jgi:hypothetical protein
VLKLKLKKGAIQMEEKYLINEIEKYAKENIQQLLENGITRGLTGFWIEGQSITPEKEAYYKGYIDGLAEPCLQYDANKLLNLIQDCKTHKISKEKIRENLKKCLLKNNINI